MPAPSFLANHSAAIQEEEDSIDLHVPTRTSSKRSPNLRRKTAWQQHASKGTGQQLGILMVVAAAAVGVWQWWKRRQAGTSRKGKQAADARSQQQAGGPSGKGKKRPGQKGFASEFSFDSKRQHRSEPASTFDAIPTRHMPPSLEPSTNNSSKHGNAKKDKKVKQARREAKRNRQKGQHSGDSMASVIAERAKAKGIADAGEEPNTGLVTTVDFNRTRDAFHNVVDWQESGKKTYK